MQPLPLQIAFKPSPFLTPSSHILSPSPSLPSTIMCFHRWPFIKTGYFGNSGIVYCMSGQWGWQRTAKKCGLSGCHVDLSGVR